MVNQFRENFQIIRSMKYSNFLINKCQSSLAVGTPVTRRPLHSPGRAVLPHPVLRSYSLSRKTRPSYKHPPGHPHHYAGLPE